MMKIYLCYNNKQIIQIIITPTQQHATPWRDRYTINLQIEQPLRGLARRSAELRLRQRRLATLDVQGLPPLRRSIPYIQIYIYGPLLPGDWERNGVGDMEWGDQIVLKHAK
ncbi:Hypothetical_protein [Hexamita inflata]|uniref:Hypothetical_protein n=1 Tax=Hexamita inflata TaxID=28002 RepID=A0AA86UXQ6_9EUKA|nr:Hypothetical protein HINF_LOCUS39918 [Hexamita inflata]